MRNGVELKKIVEERLREIGEIVDKIENEEIARELKETLEELWDSFDKLMSSVAFVEKDGKSRRDDINGLEIWLPFDNSRAVDFESIGLAGEFDFETRKITPIYVYIGKKEDVDKWFMTMSFLAYQERNANKINHYGLNNASNKPHYGMKSKSVCTALPIPCRSVSNNGYAWRVRWLLNQKSYYSMSQPPRLIHAPNN